MFYPTENRGEILGFYCRKSKNDLGLSLSYYQNQTTFGNGYVSRWRCAELCREDSTCQYYSHSLGYGGCGLATETDVPMGGGNNLKVCRKMSEFCNFVLQS